MERLWTHQLETHMSHKAIQILKTKYKLPIDVATERGHETSALRVIQELCDFEMSVPQFIEAIEELVDAKAVITEYQLLSTVPHLAKYTFRYVAQNVLYAYLNKVPFDNDSLLFKSLKQAHKYILENSWVFSTGDDPNAPPKLDAAGNVAPKKGDKQANAKKLWVDNQKNDALFVTKDGERNPVRKLWIELLVKEVGLTTAGASTYYHNLKTGVY